MNKYPGYFVGQIAELDKKQNIKQEGHGVRYRVRRFGIDSENTPPDKLLMFDTILPPTDGAGDGLRARSVNFAVGDMVFGLHLDAPQNQKGIILGVFPRTSLIQYNKYVKTEDQTTASGGDQGGERTMPTKPNVKAAQPPGSSNTAETEREKKAIEEVKKGTGATDSTKTNDPNADVPTSVKLSSEAYFAVIGDDGKTEYQRGLERLGATPEEAAAKAAEQRATTLEGY